MYCYYLMKDIWMLEFEGIVLVLTVRHTRHHLSGCLSPFDRDLCVIICQVIELALKLGYPAGWFTTTTLLNKSFSSIIIAWAVQGQIVCCTIWKHCQILSHWIAQYFSRMVQKSVKMRWITHDWLLNFLGTKVVRIYIMCI